MTSKMQDIYFSRHTQLSLYGIFSSEICHALHGVQKPCLGYINREMETNINTVFPCLQSMLGRLRVALPMERFITLVLVLTIGPHWEYWCCISMSSSTVGGQSKGQQFQTSDPGMSHIGIWAIPILYYKVWLVLNIYTWKQSSQCIDKFVHHPSWNHKIIKKNSCNCYTCFLVATIFSRLSLDIFCVSNKTSLRS